MNFITYAVSRYSEHDHNDGRKLAIKVRRESGFIKAFEKERESFGYSAQLNALRICYFILEPYGA